ncbi:FRG domain-containing protein [Pseudomonas sp. D1HM]|uniref:FRG domain-containing protein n=1 Tax=Pseudomonas sp. D1HM TaxID=1784816 RepID=UPI001C4E9424|nr:FRG domain-containing protein [Pseudomonas sp. D1HM]
MNEPKYRVEQFSTAVQLMEHLSPLNPIWQNGNYIFRGQSSDRYKLTPSICRRGPGAFVENIPRRTTSDSSLSQIATELDVLALFLDGCDRSGLTVPGYSAHVKRNFATIRSDIASKREPWPHPDLYEILAVAQHYDVPTRLLDWTTRSFVACYFAASSANFLYDELGNITVWALDLNYSEQWKTVNIIMPPGGTSKNQAAQSGLFTAHQVQNISMSEVYVPEALEEVDEIYETPTDWIRLIKMTLPLQEAPSLLHLCSEFGVNGSTLFPGFHGASKMVRDWAKVSVGVRPSSARINKMLSDAAFGETNVGVFSDDS